MAALTTAGITVASCTGASTTPPAPAPSPAPSATGSSAPSTPTPVPTVTPAGGPTATPVPSPTGSATEPPTFTLSGSTATATCTISTCGALNLAAGTLTIQFGTASATATISGSTAATMAQIAPAGFPFILSNATVEEYLAVSSSAAVTFAQTPQITISSLTGVTSCLLEAYVNQGSAYAWTQIAPAAGGAAVAAGTAVIAPVALATGSIALQPAPPFYAAVVCQ